MSQQFRKVGASIALAIGIVACGGGDGDGAPAPAPAPAGGPSAPSGSGPSVLAPSDFRVNGTTQGRQDGPQVVRLAGGGFVAAWMHWPAGGGVQVRMQRFDATMQPAGLETIVAESGLQPGLAALADGGFAVLWVTETVVPAGVELRGHKRLFNADGTPRGAVTTDASAGYTRFVARPFGLPSGRFVVASDWRVGTRGADIGAVQLFAADGAPLGAALPVNVNPDDVFTHVSGTVASAAGAGFAAAWVVSGADGSGSVMLGRFGADGNLLAPATIVASGPQVLSPDLVTLADGSLVVAWTRLDPLGTSTAGSLWFARFDATGRELGRASLPIATAGGPFAARAAALDDGGFVLTWSVTTDAGPGTTNQRTVNAQRFDAAGAPVGIVVAIGQSSFPPAALGASATPDVAAAGGSRYLVLHGGYSAEADWDVLGAVR